MTYLQAVILSIVQGIGEFLPISSSGHLILARELGNMVVSSDIDTLLHLATVVSIVVVLWRDLWQLLINPRKYWMKIFVAIIPAGIVGLLIDDVRDLYLSSIWSIAILSIGWGIVFIWLTKKFVPQQAQAKKHGVTSIDGLTLKQSFVIGLAQVLALIPGTSRSGVTTVAAVLTGVEFPYALRFSFISGFPLIAMAGLYGGLKLVKDNAITTEWGVIALALILTALIGIGALYLLTGKNTREIFFWSGVYRIILGVVLLGVALTQ